MAAKKRGSGQTAVITGASGGIGLELAACFAADGYDLVLVARSADALTKAASELSKAHGIKAIALPMDLAKPGAASKLKTELEGKGMGCDVLVNNAGFGMIGPFAEADEARLMQLIDLNIRGLTELTRTFLPAMVKAKRGGIMNIASSAAFMPGPFMAAYYASKAYVLSLTEALWEEVRGTGVRITAICPGPVATGFQDAAKMQDAKLLKMARPMSAKRCAQISYRAFREGKRVEIPGLMTKMMVGATRMTPTSMGLKLVRSLQS